MNTKQAVFAREYAVDSNATQAATRAGYSRHTAYAQGSRLLKNAEVQAEVKIRQKRQSARVDVEIDEIVQGLRSIAEDASAPPAARVSAWKALGDYKGMFEPVSGQQEKISNAGNLLAYLRERSRAEDEGGRVAEIRVIGSSSG